MTTSLRRLIGGILIAGALFTVPQAGAQDTGDRTIEQFACKDVMRDSGANRDVAIAFLHGYLLGKSGGSKFNVDRLRAQTDAFIDRCLDNPSEKAESAMTGVKK